jgi:hypothetical protein
VRVALVGGGAAREWVWDVPGPSGARRPRGGGEAGSQTMTPKGLCAGVGEAARRSPAGQGVRVALVGGGAAREWVWGVPGPSGARRPRGGGEAGSNDDAKRVVRGGWGSSEAFPSGAGCACCFGGRWRGWKLPWSAHGRRCHKARLGLRPPSVVKPHPETHSAPSAEPPPRQTCAQHPMPLPQTPAKHVHPCYGVVGRPGPRAKTWWCFSSTETG